MLTVDNSESLTLASLTTPPPKDNDSAQLHYRLHSFRTTPHPLTRRLVATPCTDTDGRDIVKVGLWGKSGREVRLFPEDFQALTDRGYAHGWRAFPGKAAQDVRVVFSVRGKQQSLSLRRIIMGAGKGERVYVRDRNPLNLRRDNLILDRGSGPNIQPPPV
jgi:hypothetical protein